MPGAPATTAQTSAIQGVGAAFGSGAPTGLSPDQQAAVARVQQAFAPSPTAPPKSETPSEPTTLSSDKTSTIADNTQKLATLKSTGLTLGADNLARYSDSSFATAPADATPTDRGTWQSGGVEYAIGPATTADPELKGFYDQINQMKATFDATSKASLDLIHQQFDQLRQQQQDINTRQQASVGQSLLLGGTARYAPENAAAITATQASYGLTQIADLNTKEQSAVVAAQQAQETGDMKLMDESLSIAEQARADKQKAAQTLSDTLTKQAQDLKDKQAQSSQDQAIAGQLANGVTDPNAIMKALNGTTNPVSGQPYAISAKDIADAVANLTPEAKDIHQMLIDAGKNGAPQDVLAKIGSAKTLAEAVGAAGMYAGDPTSTAGMYAAAVQSGYKGTPGDFVAAQKYKEAYAAESAKQAFADSPQNQQKLFQQGVSTLKVELSNRSGGLGLQDAKVNQGIHLRALLDQYKTVDANGNVSYNVPTAQLHELAIGLANLVSPTGTTAESDRQAINARTAAGDFRGAIQYITGTPQTGSTQDMIKNLADSIDRQATVAEGERQTYIDDLIMRLPPDLKPELKDQLVKSAGLNSYTNPNVSSMSPEQIDSDAFTKIKTWVSSDPKNKSLLSDIQKAFPNLSNVEVAQKLGLIPPAPGQ